MKTGEIYDLFVCCICLFLASQDAIEVMFVTDLLSVSTDFTDMTRSQYKGKYLSGPVPKILTLCRIHKIFFQKYHEKAEIQSFPTMYNTI